MYGFQISLSGELEDIISRVTAALKQEGFGILSDIDVQATLKAKLGIERLPYRILGACNPPLAHKALETDPNIGLLLPCNVVVRKEDDNSITVVFMDPAAVLKLVQQPEMEGLGKEVKAKLERVRDSLVA